MITRREILIAGGAAMLCGGALRQSIAASGQRRPRVLLLGDSISIGYTDFVIGILLEKADVTRPLTSNGNYENCEGTTKGVKQIDRWIGDRGWDVIHFNFGLHDLKHVDPVTQQNSRNPNDPQQADLEQYDKNLQQIVEKLVPTRAKLIFATTTPYPEDPGGPLRQADQPKKYNEVALPIMQRNGVIINDLYGLMLPRLDDLFPPNNVHPTKAGSLELARQVAAHIEQALAS